MNWKLPKVYAVKHKSDDVVAESRSGGMFTALSDKVLKADGVIYGAALTEDFTAAHIRGTDEETRNRMRGSKYIQSRMGSSFLDVEKDLLEGRKVLFSGTSCQIAGLKGFLRKEYQNLICVDFVCHGVPSPTVWKKYLKWQEKKAKANVTKADFRNKKKYGWRGQIETLEFDNGNEISSRVFSSIFYHHAVLRPCCYECPYKSIMHPGDITIADYWGIEKAAPEFDDNKGVSLVLVNNDVGEKIFETVKNVVRWKQTRIEGSMQLPLKAPYPMPANRDEFWNDFLNRDFEYISRKYGGAGLMNKIKRGVKKIKRWLVR